MSGFGFIARNDTRFGHFEADHDEFGLLRTVEMHVEYVAPPLTHVWKKQNTLGREYLLPLPEHVTADRLIDLRELARKARDAADGWRNQMKAQRANASTRWERLEDAPEAVRQFEKAIQAFVQVALRLIAGGCGLGLTTPEGVLVWFGAHDEPQIALLDVGFQWTKGPTAPPWLKEHANDALWKPLTARDRQERGRGAEAGGRFDAATEFVLLGRILASVLLAKPVAEIPADDSTVQPCWGILRKLVGGEIRDATTVTNELSQTPLSEHFNGRRPLVGVTGRSRSWVAPVAIVSILGALAAVVAFGPRDWLTWRPNLPSGDAGANKIETDSAHDGAREGADALSNLVSAIEGQQTSDGHARSVEEFLRNWRKAYDQAYERSARLEEAVRVRKTLSELDSLLARVHRNSQSFGDQIDKSILKEEEQWLAACRTLSDSLAYVAS